MFQIPFSLFRYTHLLAVPKAIILIYIYIYANCTADNWTFSTKTLGAILSRKLQWNGENHTGPQQFLLEKPGTQLLEQGLCQLTKNQTHQHHGTQTNQFPSCLLFSSCMLLCALKAPSPSLVLFFPDIICSSYITFHLKPICTYNIN